MTPGAAIANNARYESCPLCSSERVATVGEIAYPTPLRFSTTEIEFAVVPELWRCEACASSFVQHVVPESVAVQLYSAGASADRWSSEQFDLQKPRNQLACMNRYLRESASVLDIGCNTGELLDYAKARGCKTAGVEYSDASRRVLEKKGHVSFASVSDVRGQFDVVTAFDLVEHIYDVAEFFRNCRALVKRDGVLIVLTGDIGSLTARICKSNWWYLKYPEHVAFPSKRFFARHSGFRLDEWVKTYASNGYQNSWTEIVRPVLGGLLRRQYTGLPSIGPDHLLAVLKNDL